MLVNTLVDTRETSIRESSGHEEQHSRSFHEASGRIAYKSICEEIGLRFLDMAGGTNVGNADGGTNEKD